MDQNLFYHPKRENFMSLLWISYM